MRHGMTLDQLLHDHHPAPPTEPVLKESEFEYILNNVQSNRLTIRETGCFLHDFLIHRFRRASPEFLNPNSAIISAGPGGINALVIAMCANGYLTLANAPDCPSGKLVRALLRVGSLYARKPVKARTLNTRKWCPCPITSSEGKKGPCPKVNHYEIEYARMELVLFLVAAKNEGTVFDVIIIMSEAPFALFGLADDAKLCDVVESSPAMLLNTPELEFAGYLDVPGVISIHPAKLEGSVACLNLPSGMDTTEKHKTIVLAQGKANLQAVRGMKQAMEWVTGCKSLNTEQHGYEMLRENVNLPLSYEQLLKEGDGIDFGKLHKDMSTRRANTIVHVERFEDGTEMPVTRAQLDLHKARNSDKGRRSNQHKMNRVVEAENSFTGQVETMKNARKLGLQRGQALGKDKDAARKRAQTQKGQVQLSINHLLTTLDALALKHPGHRFPTSTLVQCGSLEKGGTCELTASHLAHVFVDSDNRLAGASFADPSREGPMLAVIESTHKHVHELDAGTETSPPKRKRKEPEVRLRRRKGTSRRESANDFVSLDGIPDAVPGLYGYVVKVKKQRLAKAMKLAKLIDDNTEVGEDSYTMVQQRKKAAAEAAAEAQREAKLAPKKRGRPREEVDPNPGAGVLDNENGASGGEIKEVERSKAKRAKHG
ncbi:hypothetical protein DFJ74DRAFT_677643 [Hyaloraphidium curvatum]|nr:hypothetical protein DFJ74DRAFT_677643 [Hyaloraphidium curvatum]